MTGAVEGVIQVLITRGFGNTCLNVIEQRGRLFGCCVESQPPAMDNALAIHASRHVDLTRRGAPEAPPVWSAIACSGVGMTRCDSCCMSLGHRRGEDHRLKIERPAPLLQLAVRVK